MSDVDDPAAWVDARQLADRFDVPLRVVRRLAARHYITPVSHANGVGRGGKVALYAPSEVAGRLEEWRERSARRSVDS